MDQYGNYRGGGGLAERGRGAFPPLPPFRFGQFLGIEGGEQHQGAGRSFQAPVERGGGWFRGSYNQQQAMKDYSSVASVSTRTGGGNTSVAENWEDIEGEYRREEFEDDAFIEESVDSKARVKQFGGFRFQHIEAGSVEPRNEQQQQYGGHDEGGKGGSFYQINARGGAYHRKPYDQCREENREVMETNTRLKHENSDLEEENKELNWQLKELYRKYTNDSYKYDQGQSDLSNLRSEHLRKCQEYEIRIGKISASERKWRLKVRKSQQEPFLVKRSNSLTSSENVTTPSLDMKVVEHDCKKSKKKTSRQVQIELLEADADLSNYEKAKLQTLREQERVWKDLNMEETVEELKVAAIRKRSRTKSTPAPISSVRALRFKPSKKGRRSSSLEGQHSQEVFPADSASAIPLAKVQNIEESKQVEIETSDNEEEFDEDADGDLVIQSSQNQTLEEKYRDPDHYNQVKNLPLRKLPIFEKIPDSMKPFQNTELARLLHSCKDPERLVQLIKVTPAEYERLTGRKVGDKLVVDSRKDSLEDLGRHVKSRAWMNQLSGVYNKLTNFVDENSEFRLFDWINAPSSDVDLVLGFFIMSLVPTEDGRALGTRFTPDTLKQLKTGLKNMMTFFLKRTDNIDQYQFFIGNYTAKRNKYGAVPQEKVQGDRKRVRILQEDLAKRDLFLTKDVETVQNPEQLLLIVGTILLEGDVARGTCVLKQIRRNYIHVTNDDQGNPMVVVKGNVIRKTNTGSSKVYKPMEFKIRGQYEVKAIQKLMNTLPPVGCNHCTLAIPAKTVGESPDCVCQHLFLHQRNLLSWRLTDKTWFARSKWSEQRLNNLTAMVSKEAGTSKVYTNGSIRPTNLTSMAMTGLTPGQISNSFNLQQTYSEQEKYKRIGEMMSDEEKRVATMINTASGRNVLRGFDNEFGALELHEVKERRIYDQHKEIMAGKQRKRRSKEEVFNNTEKVPRENKQDENVETGEPTSATAANDDKVFAKIYGFPPWPAILLERGKEGKGRVQFQNGKVGDDAALYEFSMANLAKFASMKNKFKKVGPKSRVAFLKEAENWDLKLD